MSHEIEIINGVAQIAYAGETPWHGLGVKVPNDLTPVQMLEAAGLDWEVVKRPATFILNGNEQQTDTEILVRLPNGKNIEVETALSEIRNGAKWHPTQNLEAFEFFNDFVMAGDMEMHTAGSLFDGSVVWALAKVKEKVDIVVNRRKDTIESHLLFTNPHQYGKSRNVRWTPIRVVCNNTLTQALNTKSSAMYSSNHRAPFNKEEAMEQLGIAHNKLELYKEQAQFLASKRYKKNELIEFFTKVFPRDNKPVKEEPKRKLKEMTRGAEVSLAIIDTQPGAKFAPGTWWNAFNAATFYVDHLSGKTDANRLQNAWYGQGEKVKNDALELALEYAR